jgi:hypothetical protein
MPPISLLLPAQNNFADLREVADNLLNSTKDKNLKRLVGVVGTLLYRCDLLEREVERLGRFAPTIPSVSTKKPKRSKKRPR